jgi:hypothetical protein
MLMLGPLLLSKRQPAKVEAASVEFSISVVPANLSE